MLSSFTVKALSPIVWTRLAQAGAAGACFSNAAALTGQHAWAAVRCLGWRGGASLAGPPGLQNVPSCLTSSHPRLLSPPPGRAAFMLVRLGFFVSLLALFPLQMTPARQSLWSLLFRQNLQVGGRCRAGSGAPHRRGLRWCLLDFLELLLHPQGPGLWLVTYLLLFGVYWAAAYITSIWGPLVLLGSTAGAPLHRRAAGAGGAACSQLLSLFTSLSFHSAVPASPRYPLHRRPDCLRLPRPAGRPHGG